jgi:hypothetical protein
VQRKRKEARERKLLRDVETARLRARGMDSVAAQHQAEVAAEQMVQKAAEMRSAERQRRFADVAQAAGFHAGHLMQAAEFPDFSLPRPQRPNPLAGLADLVFGRGLRLIVGSALLLLCWAWLQQNGLVPNRDVTKKAAQAIEAQDLSFLKEGALNPGKQSHGLEILGVPAEYTAWCDSLNVGVAGLLLILSVFFRGAVTGVLALFAAAVTVAGHRFGIPSVEPIRDYHASLILGMVLSLVAFRFTRR